LAGRGVLAVAVQEAFCWPVTDVEAVLLNSDKMVGGKLSGFLLSSIFHLHGLR
jgi:hypothetical protein